MFARAGLLALCVANGAFGQNCLEDSEGDETQLVQFKRLGRLLGLSLWGLAFSRISLLHVLDHEAQTVTHWTLGLAWQSQAGTGPRTPQEQLQYVGRGGVILPGFKCHAPYFNICRAGGRLRRLEKQKPPQIQWHLSRIDTSRLQAF